MAIYEVTEDKTGMTIEISGDGELNERIVNNMFSQARRGAQDSLAKGTYAVDPETFQRMDEDQANAALQKNVGYSLGVKPEDVDLFSGMGGFERARLETLPTEEAKLDFLEKKYGADGVGSLDIDGQSQLFYRDPKTQKMTLVNDKGFSLADVIAFGGSAAVPIAGAIGGAVKGATVGTAVAPGIGTVAGAIGGAAIGGFGAGVAQDVASQALAGQDIQTEEILKGRAKEAVIGAGFDVGLLGTGKFVARPFMRAVGRTKTAQSIMDSVGELNKKFGAGLEELPSMTKGEAGRARAARIAGETGGATTRARQANIDKLGELERVISGQEAPVTASRAIQQMQGRIRDAYADDIAKSEGLSKQITDIYKGKQASKQAALQSQLDNEMAGFRLPKDFDPEFQANTFRDVVRGQRDRVQSASKARFSSALESMEGVSIPASRLAASIGNTVDKLSGIVDIDGEIVSSLSPARASQLGRGVKALDKMAEGGETIPFRALHNLKQSLDGKAGYGATSPSKEQLIAREASQKVRKLIDDSLASSGGQGEKYRSANKFFRERILPFRTKQIAPLIDADVAPDTFKMTGEKLAKNAVSDPETVRQLLRNAGGAKGVIKKQLGNMYLDSLGGKIAGFNPRIASQLFDGKTVNSLNRIKDLQKKLDISDDVIKDSDLELMVNGLSGKARKEAEEALTAKMAAEDRLSKNIRANALVAKIAKGDAPIPSDPRSFAREAMKENADVASAFLAKLDEFDPAAAADFRQGVTSEFKSKIKFGGEGAQKTSLDADEVGLWKSGDVEKFMKTPEGIKYQKVMGDDWANDWVNLDRALSGSEITGTPVKEQLRAVFTTGSGLLVVAAGLPKWAYSRTMNALMGSGVAKPFLRNVERDPSFMKNIIPYMAGTAQGLEALLIEAKEDPDYTEWLQAELASQAQ